MGNGIPLITTIYYDCPGCGDRVWAQSGFEGQNCWSSAFVIATVNNYFVINCFNWFKCRIQNHVLIRCTTWLLNF